MKHGVIMGRKKDLYLILGRGFISDMMPFRKIIVLVLLSFLAGIKHTQFLHWSSDENVSTIFINILVAFY